MACLAFPTLSSAPRYPATRFPGSAALHNDQVMAHRVGPSHWKKRGQQLYLCGGTSASRLNRELINSTIAAAFDLTSDSWRPRRLEPSTPGFKGRLYPTELQASHHQLYTTTTPLPLRLNPDRLVLREQAAWVTVHDRVVVEHQNVPAEVQR